MSDRTRIYPFLAVVGLAALAAGEERRAQPAESSVCAEYSRQSGALDRAAEQARADGAPLENASTLRGLPAAVGELSRLKNECRKARPELKAAACTSAGNCCAHWMANGRCAHEYPCGECRGGGGRDGGCHPSGVCCAHRMANGRCAHEYPCPRCLNPLSLDPLRAQTRTCTDGGQCGAGETCRDGQCVSGNQCRTDADCPWQHRCEMGTCWLGNGGRCSTDFDCRFGNRCVSGACEGPW